jgi:hypothetical protein
MVNLQRAQTHAPPPHSEREKWAGGDECRALTSDPPLPASSSSSPSGSTLMLLPPALLLPLVAADGLGGGGEGLGGVEGRGGGEARRSSVLVAFSFCIARVQPEVSVIVIGRNNSRDRGGGNSIPPPPDVSAGRRLARRAALRPARPWRAARWRKTAARSR